VVKTKPLGPVLYKVYKGCYGVHMDPCTACLRCNELQYSDFTSVFEAMKDYQRNVSDHFSKDNLILILWNKVPYKLQKEVSKIKD